eukprot:CAMPEP_0198357910 /NCGR_PEP_ID=MMETSP1450-20131203/128750_1 /TAXON_ID=753684 ORGANISM="Madagascaria erythrocladiodes, Strain CCMP3234" /NCGR_SAMPLE_ID=MMETSP1450 /ASSEMBLY_ACC=CAM_ASM_001115 /LENGTH=106 /DNA_ID=CAMNT_0044064599 /DNA_START=44 /DNA_END=360 /DNA_ORIENTATION=+
MADFPEELLLRIMSHADSATLSSLHQVSKQFHRLVGEADSHTTSTSLLILPPSSSPPLDDALTRALQQLLSLPYIPDLVLIFFTGDFSGDRQAAFTQLARQLPGRT